MKDDKIQRIPYQGSKNKIADWILDMITYTIGENSGLRFVDAFGGGGSVSTTVARKHKETFSEVLYNELNEAVCSLFKLLVSGSTKEKAAFWKKAETWISREQFMKEKDGSDAWAGYLQTCWSFSNSGIGYLFHKEVESTKEVLWRTLVKGDRGSIKQFNITLTDEFLKEEDVNKKQVILNKILRSRLNSRTRQETRDYSDAKASFSAFKKQVRREEALTFTRWWRQQNIKSREIDLLLGTNGMGGHYSTVGSQPIAPTVEKWEKIRELLEDSVEVPPEVLKVIYRPATEYAIRLSLYDSYRTDTSVLAEMFNDYLLSSLVPLRYLKQLKRVDYNASINVSNLDYGSLNTTNSDVVYCDPPYLGTAEYVENGFDHDKFHAWLTQLTQDGVCVFISEYSLEHELFTEVGKIEKNARMNSHINGRKVVERLFWNGVKPSSSKLTALCPLDITEESHRGCVDNG